MKKHVSAGQEIFTVSGCLTAEALEMLAHITLSSEALEQAQSHLDSCELCADALEGIRVWIGNSQLLNESQTPYSGRLNPISPLSFKSKAEQINEHLHNRLLVHKQSASVKKARRVPSYAWLSAAASIVLFFGIYLLLKYRPFSGSSLPQENTFSKEQWAEKPSDKSVLESEAATEPVSENLKQEKSLVLPISRQKPLAENRLQPSPAGSGAVPDAVMTDEITVPVSTETVRAASENLARQEEIVRVEDSPAVTAYSTRKTHAAAEKAISSEFAAPVQAAEGIKAEGKAAGISKQAKSTDREIVTVVEQMPVFPGGQQVLIEYLSNNLAVTEKEKQQLIQGLIKAEFVVRKDGSVSDVSILSGATGSLKRKLISALKSMPAWNPGMQKGNAVDVRIVLPVRLEFQDHP